MAICSTISCSPSSSKMKRIELLFISKEEDAWPSITLDLPLAAVELQLIPPASGCTSYCVRWNYHCPPNSPPHDLFNAGHSGSCILGHILASSTSTGLGVIPMPLSGHSNFLLPSPYHLGSPWGYPWVRCLGISQILLVPGCMQSSSKRFTVFLGYILKRKVQFLSALGPLNPYWISSSLPRLGLGWEWGQVPETLTNPLLFSSSLWGSLAGDPTKVFYPLLVWLKMGSSSFSFPFIVWG